MTNGSVLGRRIMLFLFPLFTFFALKMDSAEFLKYTDNGQWYLFAIVFVFTFLLFHFADNTLKKMIFFMIFLSYIGELIFCKLLGWYTYRLSIIPLYVPFGHAIVFASGYILSEFEFLKRHDRKLNISFRILFSLTFLMLYFVGNDMFSLISGVLFFVLIRRKKWQSLYFYIAFCVIFIELVGTYYGAWKWNPELYGFIGTLNPPIGAVFFYAGGDVLLVKIVDIYNRNRLEFFKKQI